MAINFDINKTYQKFYQKAGINFPRKENKENLSENTIPSIKLGDIHEVANRKKLFGIIGISAGSVLLLTIITLFTVTKGFSGNIAKKLQNISESAKKHIFDIVSQEKNLSRKQKLQLRTNKLIQKTADAMQATSNISAIKDSFIQHWLNKLHINKIINAINTLFKNIALKTKNNAYQSAEYSVLEFCNNLKEISAKYGESPYSKGLKDKANKIINIYMKNFASAQHIDRANEFWQSTKGLDEEVYNALFKPEGGIFKNLKRFNSYITTDLVKDKRESLINPIFKVKRKISNALTDVNYEIKEALFELKACVNPKNNNSVNLINEITEILNSNKSLCGVNEQKSRQELFVTLKENLKKLLESEMHSNPKIQNKTNLAQKIKKLESLITLKSYKKGLAQEAIADVKQILATNGGKESAEYKKIKKLLDKMNKKLNIALETEDITYEKLAELQVGSAPADVIGILAPTAIGAFMVANADDKQERISNTLTKGIPILGGVGVSYYGTTRGFTGVKNLALSLITGFLLNILGDKTDKFVKSHRKEQEKLKKAFEAFTKLQKSNNKAEKALKTNKNEKV